MSIKWPLSAVLFSVSEPSGVNEEHGKLIAKVPVDNAHPDSESCIDFAVVDEDDSPKEPKCD